MKRQVHVIRIGALADFRTFLQRCRDERLVTLTTADVQRFRLPAKTLEYELMIAQQKAQARLAA